MPVGDSSGLRPPLPPFSARSFSARPPVGSFHISAVRSVNGAGNNVLRSDEEHDIAGDDSLLNPPPPFTDTPGTESLPAGSSTAQNLDSRQGQDLGFPHANPTGPSTLLRGGHVNSDLGLHSHPNGRRSDNLSASGSTTPSLELIAAQLQELQRSFSGATSAANPHHHRRSQSHDRRPGDTPLTVETHASTLEHITSQINILQQTAAGMVGRHRRSVSRGRRSRSRSGRIDIPRGGSSSGPLRSWSHVVQSGSDSPPNSPAPQIPLQFFPPTISDEGGVSVHPPHEVALGGMDRWRCTLVGYFIEGRPSFTVVRDQAMKLWQAKGLTNVMANEWGFFFFTFSSATLCSAILEDGPWIIQR